MKIGFRIMPAYLRHAFPLTDKIPIIETARYHCYAPPGCLPFGLYQNSSPKASGAGGAKYSVN